MAGLLQAFKTFFSPLTISYGEIVHKMRPHTVSVGELQVGMCFLWLSGACAPNFGPHTKFAARCITSLYRWGEADAFLPVRCLNIYPNCSRFLHYVHICHLRWDVWIRCRSKSDLPQLLQYQSFCFPALELSKEKCRWELLHFFWTSPAVCWV